ncbi:MAG: radical SAM protein [bacterium]|nr:radical SAM protein [bacterium]
MWEPIGLGYIIGYVQREYKSPIDIKFYQSKFDNDDVILSDVRDADIIAFSCTSPTFAHAVKLARSAKKINPKIRTVFGGWHIAALKEKCIIDGMDQIVIGEGEKAFVDILNGNKNQIIYGENLDFSTAPWPDRKIIRNIRTANLCESMNGKRTASFQANRVCPVSCIFCAEKIMTGKFNRKTNPIRQRSVVDVCDEIESVINLLDLNYFKFVDATFDTTAQYVIDFCQEKIKRNIDTEWEALIHASFATEDMMKWLKASNCNQINIGVESGSDKILRDVGKGVNTKTLRRVFGWAKQYKMCTRGFFILGMPNETKEDMLLTEKFIDEIEPSVVGFTILCPYPGCAIYDYEKHKNIDWSVTDEYSNDFWCTEHFTNQELKEWQLYFANKYKDILCERQIINVSG